MTSHFVDDGGAGLILTITESVGGVYTVDEEVPYCNINGKGNIPPDIHFYRVVLAS